MQESSHKMEGFHGTRSSSAKKIQQTAVFYGSEKDTEWLGKGIYFFRYKGHALEWAIREAKKDSSGREKPVVLSAELTYSDSQILDLDDPDDMRKLCDCVNDVFRTASKDISANTDTLKGKDLWKKWCVACEIYKKRNPEIGIIVYAFSERINYVGMRNNQTQICVSDPSIIGKPKEVHIHG